MVPEDITRIRWIGDPQIAPDGARVAFVVTTLSEEDDEYHSAIWIADTTSGAAPRPFTAGQKRDTSPRWSPDGRWLAFISDREPKKKGQLYVMPADGGEPVRVTDQKQGVAAPAWSPDSRRIAFTSRVGGWEEPEDEAEKRKSKPARVITTLKYQSNGEGFVYDRRPKVFVVEVGDRPRAGADWAVRQLTGGDYVDADPTWSPDGKRIAFTSARHEDWDYDNASDVFVIEVAPSPLAPLPQGEKGTGKQRFPTPRRVTDTSGPVRFPVFSPNGQTIAYVGQRHINETGRNDQLWVIPARGGTARCLTEGLDRTCSPFFTDIRPTWSPDGRWLRFAVEDQGRLPVYRVRVPSGKAAVPAPEVVMGGDRWITGVTSSHDGAVVAFAATNPTAPAEVFVCAGDGTGERAVTDLHREWKGAVTLPAPQRIPYERDGVQLDCWVMAPAGLVDAAGQPRPELRAKQVPALLNIHGGPATQYGYTFFDEFQVEAGAGYAVIFTNPRGSQGYGEAFNRAVVGDWGGVDYADVMAGLEAALAACPWIDPDRLGVLGGSYGGYMTSWIVGHTNRFKAACSERALNDFRSMVGTSDIGHFFPEQHAGALPWEDPQWYVTHSPLTYATRIETPLLILHAEDDLRCPIEQAEQLYVTLKKLRKPVRLVRFPDESHELSRSGKPRHRLERFRIILEWFREYLSVT